VWNQEFRSQAGEGGTSPGRTPDGSRSRGWDDCHGYKDESAFNSSNKASTIPQKLCSLLASQMTIVIYWQLSLTIFILLTFRSTTVAPPASVFSRGAFFSSAAGANVVCMPLTVTL
jgi:hypothetical protein